MTNPLLAARLRTFLENFQLDEPLASGNGDAYLTEQTLRLADLFASLQEEQMREVREAVQRLVKKAIEPVTFMEAYKCCVCGASFYPPPVHTAHPWCPLYNVQELVARLSSPTSAAEGE